MRPNRVSFLFVCALAGCASTSPAAEEPGSTSPPANTPPVPTTLAGSGAPTPAGQTPGGQPTQPVDAMPLDPMNAPPVDPTAPIDPTMPPDATHQLAMDECGLDTQWGGDELCINPPDPDKGFQIHIGPSDYANPDPRYVMQPGTEITEDWPITAGNTKGVYYYFRQYRMRPGSHHVIVYAGGGGAGGRRLGGSQNPAKDNPSFGIIAEENKGVGMELAANQPLSISLHYYNFTEKPILKEVWINFWYRDPSLVTEPAHEVFSMSPMNVAPGQHVVIHGRCPITGTGRALTLYGHVHANNQRFSIWRTRGAEKALVFEAYDWEHPHLAEYSSLVTNTPPDPATKTPGGWSGVLDLQTGDALEFECDIVNNTNAVFVGKNEARDDEMCILVGDSAGIAVPARCEYQTIQQ
jgi:hypothetical protein